MIFTMEGRNNKSIGIICRFWHMLSGTTIENLIRFFVSFSSLIAFVYCKTNYLNREL